MVIERAENFGLAQLHQLRGRGRAWGREIDLFVAVPGAIVRWRPAAPGDFAETEDGFRISEEDLAMRGAGDVLGTAQSGLPRFQIADLERQAALQAIARDDARRLIETDAALTSDRGKAARVLLWLMRQDRAIQMISVG